MSTYLIRPARLDDLAAMVELRTEAERWLREAGIRQWTSEYAEYGREQLARFVESGIAWVVEDEGRVVATVSLNGPDLDFWDPEDNPASALYLGKMIVARSHAGRELGDAMMNWASIEAAERGKPWLRLDCRRDNQLLHRYYLQRGFTLVRIVHQPRRVSASGALFQRPAGSTTPTTCTLAERTP